MTEIVNINGVQFLIKDGVAYEIKAGETTEEITEKKLVRKKEIKPSELSDVISNLSVRQTVNLFGKLNKENPYKIDTKKFWNNYKLPAHTKYSIPKRLVRQVIEKQMASEKLSKSKRVNILNKCKEYNYARIKWWETESNRNPIAIQNAVKSLAKENLELSEMIKNGGKL